MNTMNYEPQRTSPCQGPSWAGCHWQDQADFPYLESPNVIHFCLFTQTCLRTKYFWEILIARRGEKWKKESYELLELEIALMHILQRHGEIKTLVCVYTANRGRDLNSGLFSLGWPLLPDEEPTSHGWASISSRQGLPTALPRALPQACPTTYSLLFLFLIQTPMTWSAFLSSRASITLSCFFVPNLSCTMACGLANSLFPSCSPRQVLLSFVL